MRRAEAVIAAAILAGSAALIFTRLGHYAFWNDEAYTALLAKSVWRTGDTHAVVGHNIIAFQGGAALENLRHRFDPPLAYYLAAPFLGILGDSTLAGRLPFALCGLATVALMVWWAWRERASRLTWLVLAVAVLGNVSLMLYSRQCRYYALAMLLSTVLAYLYLHPRGAETPRLQAGRGAREPIAGDGRPRLQRIRWLVTMAAVSVCLLATNYINYAAFYACAAVDYVVWKGRHRLTRRDALVLFAPQLIIGVAIVSVWNPLGKAVPSEGIVPPESVSWVADKAELLWRSLRDINRCEYGVGLLLLAAPLIYPLAKDPWLLRLPAAVLVYLVAVTLASPQVLYLTDEADVRYLVPLIPLCIAQGVVTARALTKALPIAALPLAIVAFGTNLLHAAPLWGQPVRSTIVEYVGELARPRTTAYGAAAAWINANVREGESIWALPEYAISPLMFHAPKAVYAWQLTDPPEEQFRGLPAVHFKRRMPPDYMIAFGPFVLPLKNRLKQWGGYAPAATLDAYWRDDTRPELHWHAFRPVTRFNRATEGIYVFRRVGEQTQRADKAED